MRRLALAALALVVLTGCKMSIAIGIDVHSDGAGTVQATVTLDKAAADRLQRAGGRLEATDLRAAGWTVAGPTKRKDGTATMVATKPFRTPAELPKVIDEVTGSRHPLNSFKVSRERSFVRTRTKFSGIADLTAGLAAFGDDRLKEQTGADAGIDVKELERQAGAALNQLFSVQVAVRLPGSVSANAPTNAGNGAVWHPRLGERAVLSATASQVDLRRIVLIAIALTAAGALVVVLLRRRFVSP